MSRTISVLFWDIDLQDHIYVMEMFAIPRIGESIFFEDKVYLVRNVDWHIDRDKDNPLQEIVVSIEES